MPRKKPRKPVRKPGRKPGLTRARRAAYYELRAMIREAARTGLVAAIEHTHNFWNVSDGYKKYIEHQIEIEAAALMAAVRLALREELGRRSAPARRRGRPPE